MSRNRTLGAPYEQVGVTASFTTEAHVDRYLVSTPGSGPAVAVTLDPNAFDGDQVVIQDAAGNAGSFAIDIDASGTQTIIGSPDIDIDGGSVELTYSVGLNAWTVRWAGDLPPAVAGDPLTENNSGTLGASATVFLNAAYESQTGNVFLIASMNVLGTAGDVVTFQLQLDGTAITGGPQSTITLPSTGEANVTLVWSLFGLSIATHTFGIQCHDPTNTLTVAAHNATVAVSQF